MLSISIITFNSEKWIDQFFNSLISQNYPLNRLKILLTDNGSSDNTIHKLRTIQSQGLFSEFKLSLSTNAGFGAAHNNNFRNAGTEFCLAANIDLAFEKDTITQILQAAVLDDPDVASWEARQKPHEHPKLYNPVTLETTWSSSACTLFRRSAFWAVGGYDDTFFMYGEDVDLSWRLRAAGYKLKYCPAAVCWHYTYTESKFKKIQFLGSLLGNLYLRARFGNSTDVEVGESNYQHVMHATIPNYPEQMQDLDRNFDIYKKNKLHFLEGSEPVRSSYLSVSQFVGDWDYEQVRDGAFVDLPSKPDATHLVSIIVRTYAGRDALLRNCLQSILHQTYTHFEVLVVEDGGSSAKAIVDSFHDARLKHIACEKVGRCLTGNKGLELAEGEYIGFLDDDDLFFADHIEVLLGRLQSQHNCLAVYTNAFEIKSEVVKNELGQIVTVKEKTPYLIFDLPFSHTEMLVRNLMPIQAVLFHRSLYENAGGFSPDLDNLEDWNLWTRYSALTTFTYIKKTTSAFRTPASPPAFERRNIDMADYYASAVAKQSGIYMTGVRALTLHGEVAAQKDHVIRLNNDIANLRRHIDDIGQSFQKERTQYEMEITELREHYQRLHAVHARLTSSVLWRCLALPRNLFKRLFRYSK